MAYVNDSQTLADVVGGASAAAQMGIQNDQANQEAELKNQLSQNTLAADSAAPGLKNMFMQSQTANENAVGQQNQQTADIGKATMGSAIDAGNSSNALTISGNQAKSVSQVGQIAGQLSGMMRQIPAAARPAAMAQMAQSYGIDTSKLGPLMSGDPDMLDQVSQQANQHSAAYQEQVLKGNQEYTKQIDSTQALVQGRQGVADTNAAARQEVANTQARVKTQLQKVDNVVAQLTLLQSKGQLTPDQATALNQAREAQATAKSNPYINKMLNPDADGSGTPQAQAGSGQATAQTGASGGNAPVQNPGPALEAALKASNTPYEPTKFDYRVGPNGQIQRKSK